MKKKLALGFIGLASALTLAACASQATETTDLVTMKGDTINVTDFYEAVKNTTAAQQSMLTLVLTRVFEEQYGDKVTDDQVTESFNKTAEQYGSSFSAALAQAGMTVDTYKQQIRTTMLVEYAVEQAANKELTDENYKAAYETFTPEVTAQVIQLDSEETAKTVLSEVKADGADFAKIASEKTVQTDKKVDYTFDSSSTDLPADVMTAAFALKVGEVSEVISVVNTTTYTTNYYIVKVTKTSEKDADWNTYKDQLKKIIIAQKTSDTSFQNSVIAAALEQANVKIKDQAFSSILSQYATTGSSSETTTAASTTAADATTSEATTSAQ